MSTPGKQVVSEAMHRPELKYPVINGAYCWSRVSRKYCCIVWEGLGWVLDRVEQPGSQVACLDDNGAYFQPIRRQWEESSF